MLLFLFLVTSVRVGEFSPLFALLWGRSSFFDTLKWRKWGIFVGAMCMLHKKHALNFQNLKKNFFKTLEKLLIWLYNINKWGQVEKLCLRMFKNGEVEGKMNLFCREYRYSLDAKNRIFIPAKYREILGDSFVITRRLDPCLALYTNEEWQKYSDKINALPDSVAMELKEFIFPKTLVAEPDSQGRVIIPNDLKEYACLDKNAVIIGVGDHAQIWSDTLWEEREKKRDMDSLRNLMRQLGL